MCGVRRSAGSSSGPGRRADRPRHGRPPRVGGVSTTKSRRPGPTVRTRVIEFRDGARLEHEDRVATEEPLEIRVSPPHAPAQRVAVTMRTPGHDFELAAGWLVHEGVTTPDAVRGVRYCTDESIGDLEEFNVVTVDLADGAPVPSHGTAGQLGLRRLRHRRGAGRPGRVPHGRHGRALPRDACSALPDRLREQQPGFDRTGGVHAAGPVRGRRHGGGRARGRGPPQRRRQGGRLADPDRLRRCRPCWCSAAGSASSWCRRRSSPGVSRPRRRRRPHLAGALARRGRRAGPGRASPAASRCVVYSGADRVLS